MSDPKKDEFYFPAVNVGVKGKATLFAIDNVLLPLRKSLCYYLSKPEVRIEPVLGPSDNEDAPDSYCACIWGTVLYDEGKFRMWYFGAHRGVNPDWPKEELDEINSSPPNLHEFFNGPICYAESDDGISWVKPNLGQVKFKGNTNNNIVCLPDAGAAAPSVIIDRDDPDPNRKYKMVYQDQYHPVSVWEDTDGKWPTVRTATSPDGLHWTAGPRHPIKDFVEQASFYKFNGMYIISGHKVGKTSCSEGGAPSGRSGYVQVSMDFDDWLQESAESFMLAEPRDPEKRGYCKSAYDQVHLGPGAAPFGNVLVGLYGIWHEKEYFGDISADLGLVVSNDGINFREPVKGHIYIAKEDSPVKQPEGKKYPNILVQTNGILNVGDETLIYHSRWRNANFFNEEILDSYNDVALAKLPRDRWGALGLFPHMEEGSVWSATVRLPERDFGIYLNADAADNMRVEIADESFGLFEGYSGTESGITTEKCGLDCMVAWPCGSLSAFRGKTVRFRIHLNRIDGSEPRLYAVYLK